MVKARSSEVDFLDMLGVDAILLQRPDPDGETTRVQADIVLRTSRVVIVAVPGVDSSFCDGTEVLAYFDRARRFVQQWTRVVDVRTELDRQVVTCEFLGEPTATEFRTAYRVSCSGEDLCAAVGDVAARPVLDVCAGGLAVALEQEHRVGDELACALEFRGEVFQGRVRVQGVHDLGDGSNRYGVSVLVDDPALGQTLASALPRVSMTLQRHQLQRLTGKV